MPLRSLSKKSVTCLLIALFLLSTLFLHYIWEMAQVGFFESLRDAPFTSYAFHCFVASLGDVVIAVACYVSVVAVTREWDWLIRPGFSGPFTVWLVFGEIVTVAFELYALSTKRWAYAESMPTAFGVGLTPVLQWLVVPGLTALFMRLASRWERKVWL